MSMALYRETQFKIGARRRTQKGKAAESENGKRTQDADENGNENENGVE